MIPRSRQREEADALTFQSPPHVGGYRSSAVLFLFVALNAVAAPSPQRIAEVARKTEEIRARLIETRRDIHRHPELSNREERTSALVAQRLRELGLEDIRTNVAHHGVVAILKGGKAGPVVAIRADLDALPIDETLDVPYKSLVPGVKHACGHDAHTTIALGVAEVLSRMRGQIHGSVKFLFQPAEEGPPPGEEGGAALMIKEGALDHPRPLAIYGLHTTPETEVGRIGFRAGPAQAAFDLFTITLRGKAAYAAWPEKGVDTMLVAAEAIQAIQSIKSRRLSAFEPVLITIGKVQGGKSPHTIAEEIILEGTVRVFNEEVRKKIEELMRETLSGVTAAYGATYDLDYRHETMVVYNDPKLVEESLPSIRRTVGETNVFEFPQRMGAEDFSYYERVIPGFFLRLGSGNKAKGITAESHTPLFDIDEQCLVTGVEVMSNLVLDFLDRHSAE
jgi:amidohydrolase